MVIGRTNLSRNLRRFLNKERIVNTKKKIINNNKSRIELFLEKHNSLDSYFYDAFSNIDDESMSVSIDTTKKFTNFKSPKNKKKKI